MPQQRPLAAAWRWPGWAPPGLNAQCCCGFLYATPIACSMMPFCACMRFSAWSKMIEEAAGAGQAAGRASESGRSEDHGLHQQAWARRPAAAAACRRIPATSATQPASKPRHRPAQPAGSTARSPDSTTPSVHSMPRSAGRQCMKRAWGPAAVIRSSVTCRGRAGQGRAGQGRGAGQAGRGAERGGREVGRADKVGSAVGRQADREAGRQGGSRCCCCSTLRPVHQRRQSACSGRWPHSSTADPGIAAAGLPHPSSLQRRTWKPWKRCRR